MRTRGHGETETMITLVRPSLELLPDYVGALERGWSPDSLNATATAEELAAIASDPAGFIACFEDLEALGPPTRLPDGSLVPRLPGFWRWIWDGGFCGAVSLRWQPGTVTLPDHVPGHVGYGVVSWRQGQGYATCALRLLLPHAWRLGLEHVEVVTEADNIGSQRVATACGGVLVERFHTDPAYGGVEKLRYRILRPDL
ncbi:MAG: GNAT family N-acetyltransferase [Janthinobacterium lividum]